MDHPLSRFPRVGRWYRIEEEDGAHVLYWRNWPRRLNGMGVGFGVGLVLAILSWIILFSPAAFLPILIASTMFGYFHRAGWVKALWFYPDHLRYAESDLWEAPHHPIGYEFIELVSLDHYGQLFFVHRYKIKTGLHDLGAQWSLDSGSDSHTDTVSIVGLIRSMIEWHRQSQAQPNTAAPSPSTVGLALK